MGTHPIFESDFDCLTEMGKRKRDSETDVKKPKKTKYGDVQKMLAKKSRRSTTEKAKKISFAEEWFDQLKCENEDRIDPSGVLKLCEEIDLAPDSLEILIMSYLMNLSEMGFIRRSEWSNLESHFKITKKSNLKTCLNDTKIALTFESSLAKQVHRFAFDFCLEKEKKIIDKETSIQMLNCLMTGRWNKLNIFNEYLMASSYRGMNRDQWNNVFEFVKAFGDFDDHGAYDPDGAWPVMIDEFVEFVKKDNMEN